MVSSTCAGDLIGGALCRRGATAKARAEGDGREVREIDREKERERGSEREREGERGSARSFKYASKHAVGFAFAVDRSLETGFEEAEKGDKGL